MADPRVLDTSRVPFIPGRIHATNNLYQRYGPKGFMEIKILPNDNLYVRVDLPGVPDDGVRHRVDSVRQKVVFFSGEEALSDGDDKKNVREYAGAAGLGCDCCEITGVDAKMKDGVLRMIVSRVKVKDHGKKCTHFLPPNTGVCGEDILVLPNENEVKFYGENKEVYEHDESCRIFMGAVNGACVCAPGVPLLSHNIAWDAEFGVLTVRITPPGSNNTNSD